jgi:hypothetical protein
MLFMASLSCLPLNGQTRKLPWGPEVRCQLNPSRPAGLHPDALRALDSLAMRHRITQGINHSPARGNVHDTDGTINGNPYTGAADLSVRCLSEAQVKMLLDQLARLGFAAWYRKDGLDDWVGPRHIHAVWAGCRLKPRLQKQVESWLAGRNGLGSDRAYAFWQSAAEAKEKVRSLYRTFNQL